MVHVLLDTQGARLLHLALCCRTPYILADSVADVSLGLKLWSAHLPPLEPPSGFHVEFAVVHSEGAHWSTGKNGGVHVGGLVACAHLHGRG